MVITFQDKCIYVENISWLEFLYVAIKPIYQLPDRGLLQTGVAYISVCFVCWLVWILYSNLNNYKRYFTAKKKKYLKFIYAISLNVLSAVLKLPEVE